MRRILRDYKAFLFRGNLLDLAVAFILGAAFTAVVQSLANDVLMSAVAAVVGLEGVEALALGPVVYGRFVAALISFVVVATVLFVLIKAAERFDRPDPDAGPAPPSDEVVLLTEIRDALRALRR